MYKNVLEQVDKIAIWPVISLIIFFGFFVGLIWWVVRLDKSHIDHMTSLTKDDDRQSSVGEGNSRDSLQV
jgi:cytochrome c oxidase cbb3-type subunit IV